MSGETVTIRGSIPEEHLEEAKDKFPACAESDANLLRAVFDDWRRLRDLEESRANRDVVSIVERKRE